MKEHMSRSFGRVSGAILAAVVAVSLMVPAGSAFAAPTASEKQTEAQAALVSLNAMQGSLDTATNTYHQAAAEQEAAQAKMDEAQVRIDEANGEITNLQGKLGTRASSMYRSGETSILDILLGAASFEEFSNNWDILNRLNQNDADMVQHTKDLRAEVVTQQSEYTKQEQVAAQKTSEAKKSLDEADATVAAMQSTYDSLSSEAAVLLAQEQAAQAALAVANAPKVVEDATQGGGNTGGSTSGGNTGGGNTNTGNGGGSTTPPDFSGDNNAPSDGSIVGNAYSKLGAPYVSGGKGPNSFDCSGFVAWCYGGSVPSYTGGLIGLPRVSNPQPGDIAVIHNNSDQHCGIYLGGGMMIHAATFGVGVVTGPVQSGMIFVRP